MAWHVADNDDDDEDEKEEGDEMVGTGEFESGAILEHASGEWSMLACSLLLSIYLSIYLSIHLSIYLTNYLTKITNQSYLSANTETFSFSNPSGTRLYSAPVKVRSKFKLNLTAHLCFSYLTHRDLIFFKLYQTNKQIYKQNKQINKGSD